MTKRSNRIQFSIFFPTPAEPVAEVWRQLILFLAQHDALPQAFEFSQLWGHSAQMQADQSLSLPPHEIESIITAKNLHGFHVSAGHSNEEIEFYLAHAGDHPYSRLGCLVGSDANAPTDWAEFLENLMMRFDAVGAWQWRRLYNYWQGDVAADDRYIQRWGKLPPGYKTFKQPAPLSLTPQPERSLIDISLNPGRPKQLEPGLHFLATAEMWLGPDFWQYAACTKEEALDADFFLEKRDTPHYLYLKCWPEPFTRPDGEQGRMQQRLWKLFFNEDCEWPPGSGTICEEPMYGPPELMPKQ
jgi:hypothetical protein